MAAFLVVLLVAVGVVVLLMRAAAASGGGTSTPRPPRMRPQRSRRPVAPDDDPDFLRELGRRSKGEGPTV